MAEEQENLLQFENIVKEYETIISQIDAQEAKKLSNDKGIVILQDRYNDKQKDLFELDTQIKKKTEEEKKVSEIQKKKLPQTSGQSLSVMETKKNEIIQEILAIEKKISELKADNSNLEEKIAQLTQKNQKKSDLYKAAKAVAMQSQRSGYFFHSVFLKKFNHREKEDTIFVFLETLFHSGSSSLSWFVRSILIHLHWKKPGNQTQIMEIYTKRNTDSTYSLDQHKIPCNNSYIPFLESSGGEQEFGSIDGKYGIQYAAANVAKKDSIKDENYKKKN